MKITSTVTKVFCDLRSRKVKTKQYQVSYKSCLAIIHKIYTNLNNEQYCEIKKQYFPYAIHKLSKKELYVKMKLWISKSIKSLMRECKQTFEVLLPGSKTPQLS